MIHHLAVRLEKARVKDGFGGHGKMLLRDVVYGAVGMEAIVPFGPRNLGMGNEAYCWMRYQDQCGVYWVMRPADVEITMDNMDNPRYQHVYAHGVKFDSASRLS